MAEANAASASLSDHSAQQQQQQGQRQQHQTAQPSRSGSSHASLQGYFLAQLHDGAASWMPVAIPAEDMPPSPVPGLRRIRFQVQPTGSRELRIRSANWLASRPDAAMPPDRWPVALHMMPKLELQDDESLSGEALLLEASPAEQRPVGSPPGNTSDGAQHALSQLHAASQHRAYRQLPASAQWNAITSAHPPYPPDHGFSSGFALPPAAQHPGTLPLSPAHSNLPGHVGIYSNRQVPATNLLSNQQVSIMPKIQLGGKVPSNFAHLSADQEIGRCESGSAHSSQEATANLHSRPGTVGLAATGPLGLKLDPAEILASANPAAFAQPGPLKGSPHAVDQGSKVLRRPMPKSPEVDQQLAGSRASSELSERAALKRGCSAEGPPDKKALKQSHDASPQQSSPPDKV